MPADIDVRADLAAFVFYYDDGFAGVFKQKIAAGSATWLTCPAQTQFLFQYSRMSCSNTAGEA